MPQDVEGREPIERFLVSVDEIEKQTDLDFLSELPDPVEDRLEREGGGGVVVKPLPGFLGIEIITLIDQPLFSGRKR